MKNGDIFHLHGNTVVTAKILLIHNEHTVPATHHSSNCPPLYLRYFVLPNKILKDSNWNGIRGTVTVKAIIMGLNVLYPGANYIIFILKCYDKELHNKGEVVMKAKSM